MQSQSGTSQILGVAQLFFTSGVGGFITKAGYGAVVASRLSAGKYQFQLNTAVNDNNIAVFVTQFGQAAQQLGITYGPATLAPGISVAANTVEIDLGGGGATDPASHALLSVVFQTCFDVIDNTP